MVSFTQYPRLLQNDSNFQWNTPFIKTSFNNKFNWTSLVPRLSTPRHLSHCCRLPAPQCRMRQEQRLKGQKIQMKICVARVRGWMSAPPADLQVPAVPIECFEKRFRSAAKRLVKRKEKDIGRGNSSSLVRTFHIFLLQRRSWLHVHHCSLVRVTSSTASFFKRAFDSMPQRVSCE